MGEGTRTLPRLSSRSVVNYWPDKRLSRIRLNVVGVNRTANPAQLGGKLRRFGGRRAQDATARPVSTVGAISERLVRHYVTARVEEK